MQIFYFDTLELPRRLSETAGAFPRGLCFMNDDVRDEPLLLTPGPCSISMAVKQAMLHDLAFGEAAIVAKVKEARDYLVALCRGDGDYTAVPLQGTGTYAVEAAIGTLVPRDGPTAGKLLIHSNGVYGDRIVDVCRQMRVPYAVLATTPLERPTVEQFEQAIAADPAISHVAVVHCETSTGMLNPVDEIAALCRRLGKGLLIDAIATFGFVELDARRLGFDAVIVSANKGLQSAPGLSWVIARRDALARCKGHSWSHSLDLWDQHDHMERTGQFRFTPPTHLVLAFCEALKEHNEEGGIAARGRRYGASWRRLVDGMRQMGFQTLLPDELCASIVATFHNPDDPNYSFKKLYDGMKARGFVIFPGRLAAANTFRIACIGVVTERDIGRAMDALADVMREMGVTRFGRGAAGTA